MRLDVAENSVGSIPSAISTISMPDSHVLPSLQAQAASTLDAAIGCQDENDAADQRQEIEESLRKEVSRTGIEPPQSHYSRKVAMCEESGRLRPDRLCGVFQARLPCVAPTAYTYAPIG